MSAGDTEIEIIDSADDDGDDDDDALGAPVAVASSSLLGHFVAPRRVDDGMWPL